MQKVKHLTLVLFIVLALVIVLISCGEGDAGSEDGDDPDVEDGDEVPIDGDIIPIPDGDQVVITDGDDGGGVVITPNDGDVDDGRDDGCKDDGDCSGSDYCDAASGLCKRRKTICEPCETNRECGYNEDLCLPSGICGYYCESNDDCTSVSDGFNCENISGTSDKQCVFNDGGTDGTHGSACCWDGHCNAPYVCHPQTSRCYDGCIGNGSSACPPGQVCVDDSSDDRNGHCAPGCDESTPCQGGTVCVDGVCIEGDCATKEHCPLEYRCDTETHLCISGCDNDGDCYAYNECINGACIEKIGCEGTWECGLAEVCTVELADPEPEDRGCCFNPKTSGTELCPNPYPEGPQKFCDVCTDTQNQNQECGSNALGDNLCVTLQDDEGNPKGDFCLIRVDCNARTEGELDPGTRECPRGYTCVKIDDPQMGGKYCIADCTKPEYQN